MCDYGCTQLQVRRARFYVAQFIQMNMDIIIGICVGVSSNLCTSIGVMVHKKLVDNRRCTMQISSVYCEPMWVFGAFLFVTALVLDFVSLVFASVTIVGTLSVSNLIFNTILAHRCIGEAITCVRGIAIVFMAAGCAVVIASQMTGDEISESPNGYAILEKTRDLRVIIYIVITSIIPPLLIKISHTCWPKKTSIIYALSAGITATICLLIGKLMVNLIANYRKGATNHHATEWWLTSLSLLLLLALGVFMQLQYMAHALEHGSAVLGANIFGSTNVLSSIFSAGIALNEFEHYKLFQWLMLVIGGVATVGGIMLLTIREPDVRPCPAPRAVTDVFSVVVL